MARGRLVPAPIRGGDLGLEWRAGVRSAAWTQQQAVDALGTLWLGIAVGTLALAAITILIVSLAREGERAAELTVRRAVGAGRRTLLASAWVEAGLVGLAALAAGSLIASITLVATPDWPGSLRSGSPVFAAVAASALGLVLLLGVSFPVLFPRRRIGEAEPRSPTPLTPSAIQIGASLIALTAGALLARHAADIAGDGRRCAGGGIGVLDRHAGHGPGRTGPPVLRAAAIARDRRRRGCQPHQSGRAARESVRWAR